MCVLVCVCDGFSSHVGQGDLGDRRQAAQGVQRVLGEVGHCAEVGVQQTPWDLHGVLSRPAESLQDTQSTSSLNHTGQLQFHPAAGHTSSRYALKQTLYLNQTESE